ncbi:hypothetical protein BATDEDRAFT_85470 [Batrachochytrium dendrobatidis JAM81]|uniref:Major facilitator superfamily (MFS) profile domain-containing protein n=2 Tax=Batrachochytrium dendrobatidis TaxID=109871 RepID=F4NUP9_BATDJ|nr:uncharacterized protein BATDEDRAFT_85470 [Batrachochytrium dendrobatidis JAM81]EGF84035.1 hypothetical protein BATDEDRAFT_85470 [Batrachochytrium dendrobatidis JAM81]OAJ36456.1 hypothetical protein BDEG_20627 [Batrachochytrium dendrobatidis JEL423]|eukprot:XP_006676313.1 hypothetical protein BATDEDRAFT_85470 [Batrachochytrium dendrobatidis JAM81]
MIDHISHDDDSDEHSPLLPSPSNATLADYDRLCSQSVASHSTTLTASATVCDSPYVKPSPYMACFPICFFILGLTISFVPEQQWLILYLCRRFANPDVAAAGSNYSITTLPEPYSHLYLPGLFHNPVAFGSADWPFCSSNADIQILAARWKMVLSLCSSIPALITAPCLGVLSDHYGRKPIILVPLFGAAFYYIGLIAVSRLPIGLWAFIAVHILQGLSGSGSVLITVITSFLADTTDPAERGATFVYTECLVFSAGAFGPLIGGYLIKILPSIDFVFMISGILVIMTLLIVIFFLPESLKKLQPKPTCPTDPSLPLLDHNVASNTAAVSKKFNIIDEVKLVFRGMFESFRVISSPTFVILIVVICFAVAGFGGKMMIFPYLAFRFGWDSFIEGQYMLIGTISRVAHMAITFPIITYLFSPTSSLALGRRSASSVERGVSGSANLKTRFDLYIILSAITVGALSTFAIAFADQTWQLFVIPLFDGFASLASPTIRSLLSLSIPTTSQGQMFAFLQLLESCVGMITGIIYPIIWSSTVNTTMPNLFLVISGCLFGCAAIAMLFTHFEDIGHCDKDVIVVDEE